MALWSLLAIVASGCGGSIDAGQLPGTLDLNLLAGMRIPGAASCAILPIHTSTGSPYPRSQSASV
jgi:hypothetical protein